MRPHVVVGAEAGASRGKSRVLPGPGDPSARLQPIRSLAVLAPSLAWVGRAKAPQIARPSGRSSYIYRAKGPEDERGAS